VKYDESSTGAQPLFGRNERPAEFLLGFTLRVRVIAIVPIIFGNHGLGRCQVFPIHLLRKPLRDHLWWRAAAMKICLLQMEIDLLLLLAATPKKTLDIRPAFGS
jgi:hypothetical protein